jgi:hypothetical protein
LSLEIQISFDYYGLEQQETSHEDFTESFRDVEFDNVLKYVAFPCVPETKWRPKRSETGDSAHGRYDVQFYFDWLREKKKVEHILKVIVDDSRDPPHTDEAIEMALASFGVEELDWSKRDLDPDTVCRISNKLVKIVLHWGGNNAVLRAWSDPDVLQKLPDLSSIEIHIDEVREHQSYSKQRADMANPGVHVARLSRHAAVLIATWQGLKNDWPRSLIIVHSHRQTPREWYPGISR